MLRAARQFLGSRWPLLGLIGAAAAVAVAGWALIDDGAGVTAALALLLGLTLVGSAVAVSATHAADQRLRSVEARLKKASSEARESAGVLKEIRAAQLDPAGGPLGAMLGAQRVDAALLHDEALAQSEQVRAQLQTELDRLRADLAALTGTLTSVTHGLEEVGPATETQLAELSALANLYSMFGPADEVPVLGGYAATPQTILRLTSLVRRLPDDALIVECGSGSSTVWLALACRRAGRGRVIALEHHEAYAARTREALARHGLDDVAEVREAPLEPVTAGGEKHDWYAGAAWADLRGIDLLFVDGPPGHLGPRSRYPALALLAPALDDGAVVALDDAQRPDEAGVATDWLATGAGGVRLTDDGLVGRTRFFTASRP